MSHPVGSRFDVHPLPLALKLRGSSSRCNPRALSSRLPAHGPALWCWCGRRMGRCGFALTIVTSTSSPSPMCVFQIPRMDNPLALVGQSKFFSKLDLASGYWQVKVDPDLREKTAFITHQGLYQFRVMHFGVYPPSSRD